MKAEFELVGLSGTSNMKATLKNPNEDSCFYASISDDVDKNGLWKFCQGHWDKKKYAEVQYTEIRYAGIPYDGMVVSIREE